MIDRELVAYLAGLFDAEGSILIQKKRPAGSNKSVRYALSVTLTNTRPELVRLVQRRFKGSVVGPVHQTERQRPFYRWKLEGASARNFLREIEPYLIIKRDRVAMAHEMQDRIESHHHKPLQEAEIRAREKIYRRFRQRNKSGSWVAGDPGGESSAI